MWLSARNIRLIGSRKLLPRWLGPFTIIERIGEQAYKLNLGASRIRGIHPVFHVSLLREYLDNGLSSGPAPPILVEEAEEYEVAAIKGHRTIRGT